MIKGILRPKSVFLGINCLLLVCLKTLQCHAGIPEEYYSTGFFDKGYREEEIDSAPQHDINNNRIQPSFFVDNPENPMEFYGVYSCGHAPKEICKRVSQRELDLTREIIRNDVSDFHLGFGITYAFDKQHRPEIENLWRWYTDPNTRDSYFDKYIKSSKLFADHDRQDALTRIDKWRELLSRECILVKIHTESPIPFKVSEFNLPKTVDISHLLLSGEEILVINDYIKDVVDPIYTQLEKTIGEKDIRDEISKIKLDEERRREAFIQKRSINPQKRVGRVIESMKVNYDMVEGWLEARNCNQHRKQANIEKSKFFVAFPEVEAQVRKIIQMCESKPLLVPLELHGVHELPAEGYRQTLVDGIEEYKQIEKYTKQTALQITPARDKFNKFDELFQLADDTILLLNEHADYLGRMRGILENVYSNENDLSRLEFHNLKVQERIWANTMFKQSLNYLRAYSNAESYMSFFSETNGKITNPLFLDALGRGWPGDRLFATEESKSVSYIIGNTLIDTFGRDVYMSIIRKPNCYFTYSEEAGALKGTLIQSVSGDTVFAGIPLKKGDKPYRNVMFAIDPWNYRLLFKVTSGSDEYIRAVSPALDKIPEAEKKPDDIRSVSITEVKRFRDDMKPLFKGSWPVFIVHQDSIDAYYGDFIKPAKSAVHEGNIEKGIASIKEEFRGMNELLKVYEAIIHENRSPDEYIGKRYGEFVLRDISRSYTDLRAFLVEGPSGVSVIKIRLKTPRIHKKRLEDDILITDRLREQGILTPESMDVVPEEKVLEIDGMLVSQESLAPGIQMSEKAEKAGLSQEEMELYCQTVFRIFEKGRDIPDKLLSRAPVTTNENMRERCLARNDESQEEYYSIIREAPAQKKRAESSDRSRRAADLFHPQFESVVNALFKKGPMKHFGYVHDCILRNYFIDKSEDKARVTAIDIGGGDYKGNLGNVFSVLVKEMKPRDYQEFKMKVLNLMADYERATGQKLTTEGRLEVLKCMILTPYEHSSSDSALMLRNLRRSYGVSSKEELKQALRNDEFKALEQCIEEWEEPYLRNMQQIEYTLRLILEYDSSQKNVIVPLIDSLEEIIDKRIRVTEHMADRAGFA